MSENKFVLEIEKENFKGSGVYLIKNIINDKIYIGSAKKLKRRYQLHKDDLKNGKHHSIHLQRAYDKSDTVFKFYILEKVNDVDALYEREQYWLDHLQPFSDKGYNILKIAGSAKGYIPSEETKQKMRDYWKNNKHPCLGKPSPLRGSTVSDETKEKISIGNRGEKNGNYGKKISDEIIQKRNKKAFKAVHQLDCNGEIIKTFQSILDASKHLNVYGGAISRVCRKEYSQTKGYYFRYAD